MIINDIDDQGRDAVLEVFANAETDAEWTVAFVALWSISPNAASFEADLVDLTDLVDEEIEAVVAAIQSGQLGRLNLSDAS